MHPLTLCGSDDAVFRRVLVSCLPGRRLVLHTTQVVMAEEHLLQAGTGKSTSRVLVEMVDGAVLILLLLLLLVVLAGTWFLGYF
eukprot:SAG22_NODE_2290_length_2752_cov_2.249152_2_plen_84_part_00